MSATINVKVLTDRVIFHIHEGKPYFVPDVDKDETVLFDASQTLQPLPPENERPTGYEGTDLFWIPGRNQWVGFNTAQYMERSAGPLEEDCYGPYLVSDYPPPSEDEIRLATEKKTLVQSSHIFYHDR